MVAQAHQKALGSPAALGALAVRVAIVAVLVAATMAAFRRQELGRLEGGAMATFSSAVRLLPRPDRPAGPRGRRAM